MPALSFDDLIGEPKEAGKAAPASGYSSRALSFDDLVNPKPELNAEGRVGGAITSGLVSAVTGLAGLPADILRGGQAALDWAEAHGQGKTYQEVAEKNAKNAPISDATLEAYGGAGLKRQLMDQLPAALDYKPQNAAERAIETGASFLGGGAPFGALRSAGSLGAQVALPAATTLGAGGAASLAGLSPTATAVAEGIGGLVGGGAGAILHGRATGGNAILRDKVRGMAPDALEAAQRLMDDAAGRGVRLTVDEAYAQVTGQNANPLTAARTVVERTPEGSAVYAPLMADRPAQVDAASRNMLGEVSPTLRAPGEIGRDVQATARAAFNAEPEPRQLAEAMRAAGPRISPRQAGSIIQPELRGVYDARDLQRADVTRPLYREAENAPERIGVDRYLTGERAGEPIVTRPEYSRPQFDEAAPRPLEKPDFQAQAGEGPGESLARFIKRNGGLELTGDVKAAGLHDLPVPGVGYVAKEGGKSIDGYWRTALKEAGFLQRDADGYTTSDITNLLIRKLQNEQRGVPSYANNAERKAGRTASSQKDEYANDLSLWEDRMREDLTNAGVNPESVHPDVQNRVLGALMRGEENDPLAAYERTVGAMRENPEPYVKSTTVEEPIYAPRFGQANPQGTLGFIDQQLERGARGEIRDALTQARGLLMENGTGQTDLSIRGLGEARKAINALIKPDTPREVKSAILEVRNRLDADLSVAPEYERARSTYEQLSRPLDVFEQDGRALGPVIEQDPLSRRQTMPPERVPEAINTPSASADFQTVATPNARRAQERYVTTQLLQAAEDGRRTINPETLFKAIENNHDVLQNFPEVRQRLVNIAAARDGVARAERSTILGRVSQDPDVRLAMRTIFEADPLPETTAEISRVAGRLAGRNPAATSELLRLQMETLLNSASHTTMAGASPKAGAKWSVALQGHPVQAENLRAFMRGLPNGETRLRGFNRFMEIVEATGKAPAPQSGTAFFSRELKDMSAGSIVRELPTAVKTGGFSLIKRFQDFNERVSLGRNLDQIANILTREDSGRVLAQLAKMPAGASRAQILALRLSYMGKQGASQREE
jgi:hypothetical protein